MKYNDQGGMHQKQHNKWKREAPPPLNVCHEMRIWKFGANVMVIQMKVMKVICKRKNMMIQEFQLDVE
jgi:hypothetical protein